MKSFAIIFAGAAVAQASEYARSDSVSAHGHSSTADYGEWSACDGSDVVRFNDASHRFSYAYKLPGTGGEHDPMTLRQCCPGTHGEHCDPCPSGTFQSARHHGSAVCNVCPNGEWSSPGSSQCKPMADWKRFEQDNYLHNAHAINDAAGDHGFNYAQTGAPTPMYDVSTGDYPRTTTGNSEKGSMPDGHAHAQEISGTNAADGAGPESIGKGFLSGQHQPHLPHDDAIEAPNLGVSHNHASYTNQKSLVHDKYGNNVRENEEDNTRSPTFAPTVQPEIEEKFCMNGDEYVPEGWVGACHGKNYCKNCECKREWGAKSIPEIPGVTHGYLGLTTVVATTYHEGWPGQTPPHDWNDHNPSDGCGKPAEPVPNCKHITCSYDANADKVIVKHHNFVNDACKLLDRFYAGTYTYADEHLRELDEAACGQEVGDRKDHRCAYNKFEDKCRCECQGEQQIRWHTYNSWQKDQKTGTHIQYNRHADYPHVLKQKVPQATAAAYKQKVAKAAALAEAKAAEAKAVADAEAKAAAAADMEAEKKAAAEAAAESN